ncbi:transcriptional regulator [Streptococcus pneumoniae]|uniref:Transcriptional regulator n=2 Tax=Streptococcus pneumoniae TaxID=1313 RepID=A0A4J2F4U4_STREE|nr:transcriptional regulator [Streptococcus pneumoniae]VNQ73093.1 transcriptional regulator [Streptococcus pneumoniae]
MSKENKMRGYRNMLGLTQEKLGKKLGISKQSYYNKESGKTQFSDKEKLKIKNLLIPLFPDITIEDIFFKQKYAKVKSAKNGIKAKIKVVYRRPNQRTRLRKNNKTQAKARRVVLLGI